MKAQHELSVRVKHGQKEFEQQLPSQDRTAFPSRPEADRDITQRRGENQIHQQEQRQQLPDLNYFAQRHPSELSKSNCAEVSQAAAREAVQSNTVHGNKRKQDEYGRQPKLEKERAAIGRGDHWEKQRIKGSDYDEKEKKEKSKRRKKSDLQVLCFEELWRCFPPFLFMSTGSYSCTNRYRRLMVTFSRSDLVLCSELELQNKNN